RGKGRRPEVAEPSLADLRLTRVDRGGFHLHQHLPRVRLGDRHVSHPQNVDPAVPVEPDCLHCTLPVRGIRNEKVLPSSGSLSTQMRPPCASTAILQNASPSPVDISRPVRRVPTWPNLSKIRPNASRGMPSPVSLTEKRSAWSA